MSDTSSGLSPQTKGRIVSNSIYLGLIGYFLIKYDIMTKIVNLMENMLYAGILGVAILMFVVGLMSESGRALIFLIPNIISDTILDKTIGLNPISAYRSMIRFMEKKLKEVQTALTDMTAVRNKTQKAKEDYEAELQQALKLADAADRVGDEAAKMTQTGKISRRKNAITKAEKGLIFANSMIISLQRAEAIIKYRIEDGQDAIKMLKDDHDLALATIAAANSAQDAADAINGTGSKADIARRAQEVVKGQVAEAQAQVEMLLSSLATPGTEMDLTKLADSIEGEQMLATFQQRLVEGERATTQKLLTSGPAHVVSTKNAVSSYAELFRRNN